MLYGLCIGLVILITFGGLLCGFAQWNPPPFYGYLSGCLNRDCHSYFDDKNVCSCGLFAAFGAVYMRNFDRCQVNGRDMRHVSHQDAVKALVSSTNEVVIEVSHDPQPAGIQVLGSSEV